MLTKWQILLRIDEDLVRKYEFVCRIICDVAYKTSKRTKFDRNAIATKLVFDKLKHWCTLVGGMWILTCPIRVASTYTLAKTRTLVILQLQCQFKYTACGGNEISIRFFERQVTFWQIRVLLKQLFHSTPKCQWVVTVYWIKFHIIKRLLGCTTSVDTIPYWRPFYKLNVITWNLKYFLISSTQTFKSFCRGIRCIHFSVKWNIKIMCCNPLHIQKKKQEKWNLVYKYTSCLDSTAACI